MFVKKDRDTGDLFSEMFPFGGKLDESNRWMKISKLIPWEELETMYAGKLSKLGRPAHDPRLVIGLLLLKHMTNLSDVDMVRELSENVYMQAFCGYEHFVSVEQLDSSTLTRVRQRIGAEFFRELEDVTYRTLVEKKIIKGRGMLCDATVVPEKITYPNDVGLLNKCREKVVAFIKKNEKQAGMIFRKYSLVARRTYLDFCKKKNKTRKLIERTKRKVLNFVGRNIRQAEKIIAATGKAPEGFEVIRRIFAQQKEMYRNRVNRISERIVSISRPYVRPIKRGKDGKDVEFGPKGAFQYVNGFLFLDHLSHENFGEAGREIVSGQVANFEKLFGKKPLSFTGDNIYGSRDNRELLGGLEIRAAFRPLGRRSPVKSLSEKNWLRRKNRERNRIEGAFGHGKEHAGLKPIRYRSESGAEMWIRLGLLGMNLKTAAARTV